jgi:hypothetical protein|tara:strand:- start:138 stop:806 length:669 start_codon:yes stop_codon:yes gene_type:complete
MDQFKTVANPDGTISIVPINQGNQFPFKSMSEMMTTNNSILPISANKINSVAPVPLASASTMFQDLYYPNQGIMNQASNNNFEFLSSANERDVADEVQKPKRFGGLASLFRALLGFAVPGAGLLLGGLNTLRNTDFGRSRNLVDFLDMQKYGGYEGRERARRKTMTEARDLQRAIDRGDFNTGRFDKGITDRGRGDRSPAPSRPSRSAPSYEAAGRAFARGR